MTDNSKKVSQLPTAANIASTDRVLILRDPTGNASVRTIQFSTLSSNLVLSNTVPSTSTSNGVAGTVSFDSTYLYICVSTNSWKRLTLENW